MFIINCKNYAEVSGTGIIRLAEAARIISKEYGIKIAVAPPQHLLGRAAGVAPITLAQHVDDEKIGSTTGHVIPELLKKEGIGGAIINHSECRIAEERIKSTVLRLKSLDMISVLCARDVAEAERFAGYGPTYVAIEPPELIGSGRAVSTERPEIITDAAEAMRASDAELLCGAGIVSGQDVKKAMELGGRGILVASGIIKAGDWKGVIGEFAKAML